MCRPRHSTLDDCLLGRDTVANHHRLGLLGADLVLVLEAEVVLCSQIESVHCPYCNEGGGKLTLDDRITVINSNGTNICQSLDLGRAVRMSLSVRATNTDPGPCFWVGYIHLLNLVVGHFKAELLHSGLDRIPSGQTRDERYIAGHAEVGGVENLIGARVVKNRLGCCDC